MTLKGHTKIELTDIHTGEVETFEDDNMFTNVLETLLNLNEPNFNIKNISKKFNNFFGGIALFKDAIDTNDVRARLKNKTIASVVNNNYAPVNKTYNGIPDSSLSKADAESKTITLSYDFLTSQANGRISSVCLGNAYLGFNGYGYNENNGDNIPENYYSTSSPYINFISANGIGGKDNNNIYVDLDEGYHYRYSFDQNNILTVTKTKIINKFFNLFTNTKTVNIKLATKCEKVLLNPVTMKLWCCMSVLSKNNKIYEIDISDFDNPTVITHDINGDILNSKLVMAFTNNYMYVRNNTQKTSNTYRVNLENAADVIDCGTMTNDTFGSYDGNFYPLFTFDDGLYICDLAPYGSPAEGIVTDQIEYFRTGKCVYGQSTYSNQSYIPIPVKLNNSFEYVSIQRFAGWMSDGTPYYVVNPLLLYTINNLQTPVTKTADKTMKITYTITEVEE